MVSLGLGGDIVVRCLFSLGKEVKHKRCIVTFIASLVCLELYDAVRVLFFVVL